MEEDARRRDQNQDTALWTLACVRDQYIGSCIYYAHIKDPKLDSSLMRTVLPVPGELTHDGLGCTVECCCPRNSSAASGRLKILVLILLLSRTQLGNWTHIPTHVLLPPFLFSVDSRGSCLLCDLRHSLSSLGAHWKDFPMDFPGGTVAGNPSVSAGDTGSIPGLGRSHVPWSS